MIAYVILAHDEFDCVNELLRGIYDARNFYCICVNSAAMEVGLKALHPLRRLPNIHLISTPPTSWGCITQAYLYGIEFCLQADTRWQSLIILSGTDFPVVTQQTIIGKLETEYRDKIVLAISAQPTELMAAEDVLNNLFDDPFKQHGDTRHEVAFYNPFPRPVRSYQRDGQTYYTRPDAMRAGWTKLSNFIRHLFVQRYDGDSLGIYTENQSPFSKRLLELFFEDRGSAFAALSGIFPRDFCEYCVTEKEALVYFGLVHASFSIEECYFATLAWGKKFRDRIIHDQITYRESRIDARPDLDTINDQIADRYLFARKVPKNAIAEGFYSQVYSIFHIDQGAELDDLVEPADTLDQGAFWKLFTEHVDVSKHSFEFGVFSDKYFYDVEFMANGFLNYPSEQRGHIGHSWGWTESGLEIKTEEGKPYAKFDGLRVHNGKLLLFGFWLHHGVILAFASDLKELLTAPEPASGNGTDPWLARILVTEWEFWFSHANLAVVQFNADGTLGTRTASGEWLGYWRMHGGRLLAFGLHDMALAVFDRFSSREGRYQIAGASWGRTAAVEPCFLRACTPTPELAPNKLADAAAPGPALVTPTAEPPGDGLTMLPGSRYAKFALPLDYPPSRDFQPRWGNTHPPIAVLSDWFSAHAPQYEVLLEEMARSLPNLASIPLHFSEQHLPEPAWFGVPIAPFDSLALYTMVRLLKPQTYIEIGSGISTCFAAKAVRDFNLPTRVVSIDPQPRAAIDAICDEVIRDGLETCDLDRFDLLQPGDIVFFDGSHRSFMNSDVTVFMIDVLPRLKPGVVVHIHDIPLPWDYPDMFVDWYWNEQYLVAVYLMAARDRLDPLFPTKFVCRDAHFADRLARPFIDFGDPHLNSGWRGGGSMWFTHKADVPTLGSSRPGDDAAASTSATVGRPERLGEGAAADAPMPGPEGVTTAAELHHDRCDEAELTRRIEFIRDISHPAIEAMGFDRLCAEIQEILRDPLFQSWPLERQLPMVERVHAIYTWYPDASGRSLIPALERLFHRGLATPGIALDALCLFHDFLYFLHWYWSPSWDSMRGVADKVMKPAAAVIRKGSVAGLPAMMPRPVGREPLRLGYLAQFVLLGNPIGRGVGDVLDGLSRYLPGTYELMLYAWSEYDDAMMAMLADQGITVRRFTATSMSERISAVAEAIAADRIDILITDMNTALPAVLFERRVAPVQIFFQNGLPFWPLANIDGVFRIEFYDPKLDGFDPDICFNLGLGAWTQRQYEYAPPVEPARIAAERARFPPASKLAGIYGRLAKITPDFLQIITELLARHPQLVVLLGGTGDGKWIRDFIADRGLAGRLVLVDEYVDGHIWGHLLDVFLDTSVDVTVAGREIMAKGKPIVSLRTPTHERERVAMLIGDNRAMYIDLVSRLIEDRDFYEAACAATRDFVAAQPGERQYIAAVHDALKAIVSRVRTQPKSAKIARDVALDRLVYHSVLDELRSSAPSRVVQVDFGPGNKPAEIGAAGEILYLPALHLQLWRDTVVPREANFDADAFDELQANISSGTVQISELLDDIDEIDSEVCILSNLYSNNFFHFFEELYKVTILERGGFRGRYVLSPFGDRHFPALPPFAAQFLELLGIRDDRILMCREPTVFRSSWLTTPIGCGDTIAYSNVFLALRAALITAATAIAPGIGPRLYLERSPKRVVVNAQEVRECVSRYGFATVDMATLPVAQQIAAAHHAEVLVGTHGSGMLHCAFQKEKSTVIECFSPHFMDFFILDILHILDHRYSQIVAMDRRAPIGYEYGVDVVIDCHHLELVLKQLPHGGDGQGRVEVAATDLKRARGLRQQRPRAN